MSVLTPDQREAMRLFQEEVCNIFLTGGPGTGKSYLIRQMKKEAGPNYALVASTGAAAILIGGRTFHSYFSLGILQGGPTETVMRALKDRRLKKRLKKITGIIIDEVSMLNAEALECAEQIARKLRDPDTPWGGLRVVAVGDFAQLPPVSRSEERGWCFHSPAWRFAGFRFMKLTQTVRSRDPEFLRILEKVRWGILDEEVRDFLDSRVCRDDEISSDVPRLFPFRNQAESFNRMKLAETEGIPRSYPTEYTGDSRLIERLKKDAPIPEVLELKTGAVVMIRINDAKNRFVNGTLGTVMEMEDEVLLIQTRRAVIELEAFSFTILDDDGEELASATNFPVHLAYAGTIHKIQGATMDQLHADLSRLWEPGQAYVALSRVRHAEDITISGWDKKSFVSDPQVKDFYDAQDE